HDGVPVTTDRLSVAPEVTDAEPFRSTGFGLTDAVTTGSVLSYLNSAEAAGAEVLPALSVQVPETLRPVPSGPLYVPLEQLAIPEVASVPVVVCPTGAVYQP